MDIRDGALDFLFNTYKRILPTFGGFITSDGGKVDLSLVDQILAEVAAIEDKVFAMRHRAEEQDRQRKQQFKAQRKANETARQNGELPTNLFNNGPAIGRAAKVMEGGEKMRAVGAEQAEAEAEAEDKAPAEAKTEEENAEAAEMIKQQLMGGGGASQKEKRAGKTKTKTKIKIKTKTKEEVSERSERALRKTRLRRDYDATTTQQLN